MTLHLIKLCVGADSVKDLTDWIKQRLAEKKKRGLPAEHVHTTRMMPKRAEELLDGGSLYWVIRGEVLCRQKLKAVRPIVDKEGISRCQLVLEPKIVHVQPRTCRAFQGWRYLEAKDSPPDAGRSGSGTAAMPEKLRRELRDLGLM
jgi:hypothetical protein